MRNSSRSIELCGPCAGSLPRLTPPMRGLCEHCGAVTDVAVVKQSIQLQPMLALDTVRPERAKETK